MAGMNLHATSYTGLDYNSGWRSVRGLRDGSLIQIPWIQSLVFSGRAFGANAGDVSTGIAGHVAVDADQPEMAVRVPDGTIAMPLVMVCSLETGSTTLGVGGMMAAVSNIDVGNGTSTAVDIVNLRLDAPIATACTAREAYSGNGTDPLTAGNFIELLRQGFILDSDAATSGFLVPSLRWSAAENIAPIVMDAGSLLIYAEHANNAPTVFAHMVWAEFSESGFLS